MGYLHFNAQVIATPKLVTAEQSVTGKSIAFCKVLSKEFGIVPATYYIDAESIKKGDYVTLKHCIKGDTYTNAKGTKCKYNKTGFIIQDYLSTSAKELDNAVKEVERLSVFNKIGS
jgi:hypothetical protein